MRKEGDTMKKITVVIPNFNGIQYVERCLDSLKRQTFSEFDVIFVDNGSVDGDRKSTRLNSSHPSSSRMPSSA